MGQVSLDFVIPMDTAANDYGLTCGVHVDVVKAVNKLRPKSGLPCRLISRPSTESIPPVLEHWRCRRPGTRLLHSTNKIRPHIDLSVTMWASATYRLYQEPENWTSHWTLLCVCWTVDPDSYSQTVGFQSCWQQQMWNGTEALRETITTSCQLQR